MATAAALGRGRSIPQSDQLRPLSIGAGASWLSAALVAVGAAASAVTFLVPGVLRGPARHAVQQPLPALRRHALAVPLVDRCPARPHRRAGSAGAVLGGVARP